MQPTRHGREATADSLRVSIADKLSEFLEGAVPLLDELAAAVLHDCTLQRGRPADAGTGPPTISVPPISAANPLIRQPRSQPESATAATPAETQIDQEAQAIALLFQHTNWGIAEIAKCLKVNRKTLYKWPNFRKAAELSGRLKPRGPKAGKPRRGHKTPGENVEAYQEEGEDE